MNLIAELVRAQRENGYLSRQTLEQLSDELGEPLYRLQELVSFYPHLVCEPPADVTVSVCRDVSCLLGGASGLADRIRDALGRDAEVHVREVSCLGHCDLAPAVMVGHQVVRLDRLDGFLASLRNRSVQGAHRETGSWLTDPYPGREDRYGALRKVLCVWNEDQARDEVLGQLDDAGLRGMGGAAFPTGRKWQMVRDAPGPHKYVICNADESEPGTFKDRVILEDLPHLVVEGLAIDAFTVGARRAVIYLRHEYEKARVALEREIQRARVAGLVGPNVMGCGMDLDMEVFVSPGGYILGEETALIEALEGKRGEPRNKPPYPGQAGLFGCPTLVNNVETLSLAPAIVMKGARWWKQQGRNGSSGLKFMAVSGHVTRPGVYQVPLGTPVSELIELAGGMAGGRPLKAFSPGGASARFLPASAVQTPIDFDAMKQAGSMLGSGALVVVAEPANMLELAANLTRFFAAESCGKCVPCRVGSQKALDLVGDALEHGRPLDPDTIRRLDMVLREGSICGLGQVVLSPLMSVMEHWPDEVPLQRPGGGS